jgi:hypothetical protein
MRIKYRDWSNDVSEVLKHNTGNKLLYDKGTMKGMAWCTACGRCVGNIFCSRKNTIYGWLDTECVRCGTATN